MDMSPTSPSNSSDVLSIKLLVDTKRQRVLYVQAGKDIVDFLFSLLALPIATAAKLMGQDSVAGSVGSLYASLDHLDETYVQPAARDAFLQPKVAWPEVSTDSFLHRSLPSTFKPARSTRFFRCGSSIIQNSLFGHYAGCLPSNPCVKYVTDTCGMTCPSCRGLMNMEVEFLSSQGSEQSMEAATGCRNGVVQHVVTYTVTDDLKVAPMSTISGITLLKTFGITDIGVLEEKTVQLGYAEGLDILRLSMQSRTVLSDVFLWKKHEV